MAPGGQTAENLVKVGLGPPGLGVQPIQPVDDKDLQERAPWFRSTPASSAALEKRVQYSVHESGGILAAVGLGQMDTLLNRDLRGDLVKKKELGGRQGEGSIDPSPRVDRGASSPGRT